MTNFKFIFKITTILGALAMTVYCIYLLNQGHLTDFLGSVGSPYSETLNWCSNRIVKIEAYNQTWTLEEKDKKWMITKGDQTPQTLEYLDVEKWLAKYCQVHIQIYRNSSLLDKPITPIAKAYFNDGKTALISVLGENTYQIADVSFKSIEMTEGLADLKKLLALP